MDKSKLEKINLFAEKALIFSSEIEGLRKQNKKALKVSTTQPPSVLKLTSLKPHTESLSGYDEVSINLQGSSKDEETKLLEILSKVEKLKALEIKTTKTQLKPSSWQFLINHFSNLKFLRELRLHLNGHLEPIANLFESSYTQLRPIDKLHLKVSDTQVDIAQVIRICNSFELSALFLTLSRCNLKYHEISKLLCGLRLTTRMTNLPMGELQLILTVNDLNPQEITQAKTLFERQSEGISKKSIQL